MNSVQAVASQREWANPIATRRAKYSTGRRCASLEFGPQNKRNLNITNHAERTDDLCRTTQAKCNEIIGRFEAVRKNIGAGRAANLGRDGTEKSESSSLGREQARADPETLAKNLRNPGTVNLWPDTC